MHRNTRGRRARPSVLVVALLAVFALVAGACSDDGGDDATGSTTTMSGTTVDRSDEPEYAEPGPYPVGFTTLKLDDGRAVLVWYPADLDAVEGAEKATYDQRTPLPEQYRAVVPDAYNTVVTMEAYADAGASGDGPYPVVLFAHGLGAYPQVNSALNAGIASWGFVVASADYHERGIVSQVSGTGPDFDAARDEAVMLASLDLLEAENLRSGSLLEDIVDTEHVGSAGHSAGGRTAFDALDDDRIDVAIGWAPVAPSATPPAKPTMIIGAQGDIGITPAALSDLYAGFSPPKRFVEIADAGHNTFTDVCPVIRSGGGLLEFARQNNLVSDQLLQLGLNGCEADDLDAKDFWPVVQHFTVAELRDAFGIDDPPVGLGPGIETAFAPIELSYEQDPPAGD